MPRNRVSSQHRLQFDLFQLPELDHEVLEFGGVVGKPDAKPIGEVGGDDLPDGGGAVKVTSPVSLSRA